MSADTPAPVSSSASPPPSSSPAEPVICPVPSSYHPSILHPPSFCAAVVQPPAPPPLPPSPGDPVTQWTSPPPPIPLSAPPRRMPPRPPIPRRFPLLSPLRLQLRRRGPSRQRLASLRWRPRVWLPSSVEPDGTTSGVSIPRSLERRPSLSLHQRSRLWSRLFVGL
ncbi:uncharacterized protein M6B38_252645 [Iris pallida]|uniref:Uncharacterized protein n=1 Tax=Iris pallida TaxID=29817 RepID=A0AAX6IKE0_IRIPA|nr:uncharacterized protein M6B38_252645 [Iris pallida]